MVKVQAVIDFTYKNYNKIKDLKPSRATETGKIFKNDIFTITNKEAVYLSGENENKIVAIKVLEVIPEQETKIKMKKEEE